MRFLARTLVTAAVVFGLGAFPQPSFGHAVAALLVAAVLCLAAACSTASGAELVAVLATLYFVFGTLVNIPEGVLFDVVKVVDAPVAMARELGIAIVLAVTVAAVFGRVRPAGDRAVISAPFATVPALLTRLAAAVAVFVVCYFVAGMIIFPFVKDYYAGRAMPGPGAIVSMQLLRAVALVATASFLLRTIPSRRHARLVLALALPVLGAIAQLIPPNPLMPPAVRIVHGLEITPYYVLFGFLLATWFGPRRALQVPGTPTG